MNFVLCISRTAHAEEKKKRGSHKPRRTYHTYIHNYMKIPDVLSMWGFAVLAPIIMMMKNSEEQSGSFGPSRSPSGPNTAECFVHKYLVHVLVVLLHARCSVVGPIPFVLATIFFRVIPI